METIEEYIKKMVELGFMTPKGEPLKCQCGHEKFLDKVTDRNEHGVLEFDRICTNCDRVVGNWAYGQWMI